LRVIYGALDGAGDDLAINKSEAVPARGLEEGVLSVKVKMRGKMKGGEAVIQ
jgi:hypothetical protein